MSVRLTDDEIRAFLEQAHTGILTTLRRDGSPISLPMWFVALEGKIYVQTPARAKKIARLRRDPRIAFLVESGERWAELKAVHISGRAEIVSEPAEVERVSAAMMAKYERFRTRREHYPEATRRHYEVERLTVRIVPTGRTLSWDNAKIRLRSAG